MKSTSDLPEQTKKIFENFLQRDVKQVNALADFISKVTGIEEMMNKTENFNREVKTEFDNLIGGCVAKDKRSIHMSNELLEKRNDIIEGMIRQFLDEMYPNNFQYHYVVKESVPEKSYTGYTWMNCSVNNSFIGLKVYYQNYAKDDYYKIEKVIELGRSGFEYYSQNLNQETNFIVNNKQIMGFDEEGYYHCIFIKKEESNEGILVYQNENGKIYSGYLPDYTVIEH